MSDPTIVTIQEKVFQSSFVSNKSSINKCQKFPSTIPYHIGFLCIFKAISASNNYWFAKWDCTTFNSPPFICASLGLLVPHAGPLAAEISFVAPSLEKIRYKATGTWPGSVRDIDARKTGEGIYLFVTSNTHDITKTSLGCSIDHTYIVWNTTCWCVHLKSRKNATELSEKVERDPSGCASIEMVQSGELE